AFSQAGHDHASMHAGSDSGYQAMKARGAVAMGVDQDRSTHKFTSLPDGGLIRLTSDVDDSAAIAAIRKHFSEIETAFAAGDFRIPAMVHAQEVPGTAVMTARASAISYRRREVDRGAELRITTRDKAALAAVHQFLLFQRTKHHAGQ
ncbi:MAG TPA: hypothetical protein VFU23_13555, partial [Gemmatimonadales bacterium]|nr:hypothetical protein [Gemmatimonadales bacterium]